jgi:DNA recombination protein RmuC
MDFGVNLKVILATPMTLIALLRTVAYGYKQENLRENARRIGVLGSEIYSALTTMTDYMTSVGSKLASGLDSYNKMIGSFERNVLSKARRLKDFGAVKDGKSLPESLDPIDLQPRLLTPDQDRAA